jgi:hypothetical protein
VTLQEHPARVLKEKHVPRFEKAMPRDAKRLARVSERAFHSDIHYGAPGLGGPPGYDSDLWQMRMMTVGEYYKILVDDRFVGGVVVRLRRVGFVEIGEDGHGGILFERTPNCTRHFASAL